MVNPDSTKINYLPNNEDSETQEASMTAPIERTNRANKDFKKVLGKGPQKQGKTGTEPLKKKTPAKMFTEKPNDEDEGLVEEPVVATKTEKDDEENASAALSPFELIKGARPKEEVREAPKAATPIENVSNAVESPSDLFKRMSTAKPLAKPSVNLEKNIGEREVAPMVAKPADKFTTRYTPEQPDLTYVNPLAGTVIPTVANAAPVGPSKVERPAGLDENMRALIDQIVKTMYTVKNEGKTETVLTLQYPPLFKDAKVTVTAFDSARGEFNITFDNLTQAAQLVLDKEENKKSLLQALEHKGYNVQIYTTTTVPLDYNNPISENREDFQRQQRDQHNEDQQDQQQRQRR